MSSLNETQKLEFADIIRQGSALVNKEDVTPLCNRILKDKHLPVPVYAELPSGMFEVWLDHESVEPQHIKEKI